MLILIGLLKILIRVDKMPHGRGPGAGDVPPKKCHVLFE